MPAIFKFEQEQQTRQDLRDRNQSQLRQEQKSDLAQKQRVNGTENGLEDALVKLENGKYGIGSHEVLNGTFEQKEQTAQNINENGLNIQQGARTTLSTMVSLGDNSTTIEDQSQGILKRRFVGESARVMAVVAVPLVIENSKGEKLFIGFPEKNEGVSGQQYSEHAILDRIVQKMGRIPKEFILGYAKQSENGEVEFEENPEHYSHLEQEKIDEIYEEQSQIIENDPSFRPLHEMIREGQVEKLRQFLKIITERGLDPTLYENAIALAENVRLRDNVRQILREKPELSREDEKVTVEEKDIQYKSGRRIMVDQIVKNDQGKSNRIQEQIIDDRDKGEEEIQKQNEQEKDEKEQYKDNGERSPGRRILDSLLGLGKEDQGLYEDREITHRGKSNARTILADGAKEMGKITNPNKQITNEGEQR